MKRNARRISMIAVCVLCSAAVAEDFSASWFVVAGGGAMDSVGGEFALSGTVGQGCVDVSIGSEFTVEGGFWRGVPACFCRGDMTNDTLLNGADIRMFVRCLVAPGGNCDCADVNGDFVIDINDVSAFVNKLLFGPPC